MAIWVVTEKLFATAPAKHPWIVHKSIAGKQTSLLYLGWAMQQKDFCAAVLSLLVLANAFVDPRSSSIICM